MDHIVLKGIGSDESVQQLMKNYDVKNNVMTRQIDNVEDTITFIRGASLVISNDTGIRHLAIAGGIPSIGVFSVVDPFTSSAFRYWPRFGQHEIAITADGSWPDTEHVLRLAIKLLSR